MREDWNVLRLENLVLLLQQSPGPEQREYLEKQYLGRLRDLRILRHPRHDGYANWYARYKGVHIEEVF